MHLIFQIVHYLRGNMFFVGPYMSFSAKSPRFYCDMDVFPLSFLFYYYPVRVVNVL